MNANFEEYQQQRKKLDDQFFRNLEDNKVRFDLETRMITDAYFRARRELDLSYGIDPYGQPIKK